MDILLIVIGWLLSLVALYVVIRLAVSHAIRPPKARKVAPEVPHDRAWFDQAE